MAIGGVISNRNFGSFIGSGKGYQTEPATAQNKGGRLSFSVAGHVRENYKRLFMQMENYSISRYSHFPCLRVIGSPDGKALTSIATFHVEGVCCLPMSLQSSDKFWSVNPRRRIQGICKCYLSSNPSLSSWIQPSKRARLEGAGEVILAEENLQSVSPWWQQFPKRWVIVLLCFAAFLLCNMDRVNMSIAILPMSQEFNWNSATVGLIQSSFFWGYLLTQILGGIWADKLGGKLVLGFGVIWWSVATVLTPIAARIGLPFLLTMRAFMGIGEGVAMPAMNNILSKWIPVSERSRSLALVYSGMYLGSVTGLAVSPALIQKFGWPSVFYSFGSLGSIWFALWLSKAYSSPAEDPELSEEEKRVILGGSTSKEPVSSIPWKLILSKAPVWALIISHFCHNWGTFILLTWMPTYYNQVLKFNLTESGLLCVLPWLTMAVFANIGGWIADTLVSKGLSITSVRKIMQSIGFLGPAFFLTQLGNIRTPALAVLCMACSQGSDAFSQSGLYSNHQDIGPRYAGVLLGLSNTAGVLAGVFGTAATGYILQRGSWGDVFKVAVVLYIIGTLVWNLFATGEKILD
ncbi:unnamed protein product, partial [Vitis vinifera]